MPPAAPKPPATVPTAATTNATPVAVAIRGAATTTAAIPPTAAKAPSTKFLPPMLQNERSSPDERGGAWGAAFNCGVVEASGFDCIGGSVCSVVGAVGEASTVTVGNTTGVVGVCGVTGRRGFVRCVCCRGVVGVVVVSTEGSVYSNDSYSIGLAPGSSIDEWIPTVARKRPFPSDLTQ